PIKQEVCKEVSPDDYSYVCRTQLATLYSQLKTTAPSVRLPLVDHDDFNLVVPEILSSLEARGLVGDLESMKAPYLRATLSARFGYYGSSPGESVIWMADWLSGDTHHRVALGGPAHCMLATVPTLYVTSSSATRAINLIFKHTFVPVQDNVKRAIVGAAALNLLRDEAAALELLQNLTQDRQPLPRSSTLDENTFTRGLALASAAMESRRYPIRRIRTVFRVLGRWRADHVNDLKPLRAFDEHHWFNLLPGAEKMDLTLGSPLYVSVAD
ncbi:MAG: hypothetical protein WBW33_36185, partial [Bryobacteraceae bacterium]